jgi:D-alanyl-D-alanine carboxypeptidase
MRIITGNRYKNNGEIASLTKIMTFYSVLKLSTEKKIDIANTIITVDEEASEMTGTSAELVVGDLLSVEQLLYGLMLPSGNDAAMALAKWAGDLFNSHSSDACPMTGFVTLMNKHAKELGMKQSSFGNPHGLPNLKNTSNPFDLSILIGACLKMPLFRKIVGTQNYNIWITNEGASKELVW